MLLSLDSCRDSYRSQILTAIVAPSASALVGVCRREVRERSVLEGFFCLYLRYLQSGDYLMYLFASLRIFGINVI